MTTYLQTLQILATSELWGRPSEYLVNALLRDVTGEVKKFVNKEKIQKLREECSTPLEFIQRFKKEILLLKESA